MDLTFNERELTFRDELRAWLSANDPGAEPENDEDANYVWRRDFQRELAKGGWAAVHWPVEYGGRGATLTESAIFFEELGRSGSPLPANVLGLLLAGPTIMTWGTAEQKDRYLNPILSAEEIWCQGFSEPDAGSDFASVKTRAIKDNGGWRGDRPEGLDQRRAVRAVVHARRSHGSRGTQAQGADLFPDGHGPGCRPGAAAEADHRRAASSTSCSSTTPTSLTRTCSVARATAGRSR